jgi:hypothetical protein
MDGGSSFAIHIDRLAIKTMEPTYAAGVSYSTDHNESARKRAWARDAPVELADLDRVPARAGGHSRLLPVLCKISRHQKRAMGELAHVCGGRLSAVDGSRQGFRSVCGLPRKDRWPNPCGVESWGRGSLRVCNVVCLSPNARSGGRAQSGGESARVYACRYQRKYGCDVYAALRADSRHGRAKTTRVAFGFLPRILVTVLQLRVAGYSEQFERAGAAGSATGSHQRGHAR